MKPTDFPTPPPASAMLIPFSQPLENIEEDFPLCRPLSSYAFHPPDTPQEPMEFLSRSWSISALQVAKALDARRKAMLEEQADKPLQNMDDSKAPVSIPFTFASSMTAQMVMDRIMVQHSDFTPSSRRKSLSSGSVNYLASCPDSPTLQGDELTFCRSFSAVRNPLRELSMKRWLKDIKEKRKEASRAHNARVHAAMSVAGVAAAVAAIAAATATTSEGDNNEQSKTSMAVASAAALVAAQCVEVAESIGAARDQMSSMVSSAVSVKTPGDIMTLTAAAATALRGAAALNARIFKDTQSLATISHEKCCDTITSFASESVSEDSETDCRSSDSLSKGCEFLKRTRNGDLHWRLVFAYLNKDSQVVVKSQGKYMGGAITKNKKRLVLDVYNDIPSWPERCFLGGGEKKWYFGIKTDNGVMELECKTESDYRLWTEGISHLLSLSQNQKQR